MLNIEVGSVVYLIREGRVVAAKTIADNDLFDTYQIEKED
jgi:hypothetical protein